MKTLPMKKMISVLGMSAFVAGLFSTAGVAQPYTYPGQASQKETTKSEPVKEYKTLQNTFDKK